MRREGIQGESVCISKGRFGKPDLNRVEVQDRTLIIKDVRKRNFFFRWTLGIWLIQREWKVYARLAGIKGIPNVEDRIDRFAFAMEFVHGRPIHRGETLPLSFFSNLESVLEEVHSRGVVHMDLRHKGNVLISETGEPILIDFNSSFSFKEKGVLRRFLFPLFVWVDYGGLLKLKRRVSPSLMTSEEISFLKRFDLLRRLWIFN